VKHCIRRHPEAANRCSPEDGDDISVGGYVRQKRGTALCETEKVGRTYGSQPIRIFRVLCSTPRPALRSIGQNGVTTKILKQVDRSLRVVQALLSVLRCCRVHQERVTATGRVYWHQSNVDYTDGQLGFLNHPIDTIFHAFLHVSCANLRLGRTSWGLLVIE
jgi:hypothetical protein